ncbi:MAG TPA: dodecin family protein, partial [Gammaproteobacteria bacterium]|nr:dodecin family protein [Gammaproteobacteria bacterium]
MTDHVYKTIELTGSSTTGTDDAIRNAVAKAAKSVRHMDWFEVME